LGEERDQTSSLKQSERIKAMGEEAIVEEDGETDEEERERRERKRRSEKDKE
jgi:hypothetical protein